MKKRYYRFQTVLALFVSTCALLSARHVSADAASLSANGMDLHLFRPAIDSKGHISVNGAQVLGAGDVSFGLVLDVGLGIMPFNGFNNDDSVRAADAKRTDRLISSFWTGTLQANYGIANFLVVGAQLPVQLVGGPNQTIPGTFNDAAAPKGLGYQGLGNFGLHAKARFLRTPYDVFSMAAIARVEFPTGKSAQFAGEPGFALWPELVAEWKPLDEVRIALNGGYRYNSKKGATFPWDGRTEPTATSATLPSLTSLGRVFTYDDLITAGLGMSVSPLSALDIVVEAYANQIAKSKLFGKEQALAAEALGGLKIYVERNSYLMAAAGIGLTSGFSSADVRGVLAFIFEPSIGDRDGDGIKDDVDQCDDEPEDFDGFQDEDGCPDPDNDGDGILDRDDDCPLVPEDFDGDQDEDGCPEGSAGDRDGDGIPDSADKCPDEPEDMDGFQDEDGCPDPDNDGDGILDKNDLCPNDPEDKDGFEDKDGCPDPDNDKDRILDVNDSCPNEPETYNGKDDDDGCPDKGLVVVQENQILILEKIYFETNSAEIQARSFPLLDAVGATLNGNPQIRMIEIQGHADERSADDYNIKLTRARAASVRAALIDRGVDPGRMRSAGYGERCPVDPKHNAEAWEKNRRVEFKILETDDGPTGVEVACPAGRSLVPK